MKTQTLLSMCWGRWVIAGLWIFAAVASPASEQTQTETKIRLMSEALRARDAGELEAARGTVERLLEVIPNDPRALRLLNEIDALVAAREEARLNPKPPPMQDVVIPEPEHADIPVSQRAAEKREDAASPARDKSTPLSAESDLRDALTRAAEQRRQARELAIARRYDDALALLNAAGEALPAHASTKAVRDELERDRREIEAKRAVDRDKRKTKTKRAKQSRVEQGGGAATAAAMRTEPDVAADDEFARGRSQYLAGDLDAAESTFSQLVAANSAHRDAQTFLLRIARDREKAAELRRQAARTQLMTAVADRWQMPDAVPPPVRRGETIPTATELSRRLEEIILPSVSFTRAEIGQVVASLSAMAAELDAENPANAPVNIVLIDPANQQPTVTLALRNASLKRVLDFVTDSIGYRYEMLQDAVVLRPDGEVSTLSTGFYAVSRATVLRMSGAAAQNALAGAGGEGPQSQSGASNGIAGEAQAMQAFLQQAGVSFAGVSGSSLAYDGSALIVTQTPRNLDRIRTILSRYEDVRQVEIEAKFIEVQEGVLEELGVNWMIGQKATQHSGARAKYRTSGRSLASTFGSSNGNQQGRIVRPEGVVQDADGEIVVSEPLDIPIINNAPRLPGSAELAAAAGSLADITGVIGEFDVNAVIRALAQQQGTDLLSAPKVTVLSGNPATITVAQEMRYPQSFGQTQSQVGTGNASGGGSAGVAITAGTPQEFTKRNVGVELRVVPTVEEDDYSISLDLNPKVTEFDGFVEYGGPSIAISGSTTVTVPSGFYQPIFSVRDISTRVTLWDGATLVMGGLTREEVKKVDDKVPILGDLPLIGRAFRSKGESSQKRNLLIFVTARLVNPGGGPKNAVARTASPRPVNSAPVALSAPRGELQVAAR